MAVIEKILFDFSFFFLTLKMIYLIE